MKSNPLRGRAGFTLIELMAVIVIIVILATLIVGGMNVVQTRQAESKTQIQIKLLETAIESYKADMGKYPGTVDNTPASGDKVSKELYQALYYEGYTVQNSGGTAADGAASRIYLNELDPITSKQGWVTTTTSSTPPSSTTIRDPWDTEFRYRKGSNAQNPDFDIWSCGRNQKTDATSAAKTGDNKDDIRNF